ncbi:hypothetical protein B005_1707 [Nocardiopsis alba ATCC BAA-2165]|uniref:Uncharacterized protein n=1 Tax=Nocardiopsis alba (strain ATCC BAA-2165 / BE74) TaxID=1205910 RepID=J7L4G0_NOCAA|nr:hypothetical protein B005_1707 [Nocardiopsis alba ATCC BAA-2165]
MSAETIPLDLRRVLDAPRGRRFNRSSLRLGTRPETRTSGGRATDPLPPLASLGRTPRERAILARMPDTPGLRRRFAQGDLPEWIRRAEFSETRRRQDDVSERTTASRTVRQSTKVAEPEHPGPALRPRREHTLPPPLSRRSDRFRRPAGHRKPRRRIGLLLAGYAFAVLAGAMAQPLIAFLS